jgi:hypothetical protein
MNFLVKTISTEIRNLKRFIKFYKTGRSNVQTAQEAGPYGDDSNPIKDMVAVFADTSTKGKKVIIGYVNKNQLAGVGEKRIFSTDADGELQAYIWLKNDGAILLGGEGKNLVRYQELETGFNALKDKVNALISKYNAHVHSGVTTGGGSSGPTPSSETSSSASISGAKIEEIKTL